MSAAQLEPSRGDSTLCAPFTCQLEEERCYQRFLNPSPGSGKEHSPAAAKNHTGYSGNANLGRPHASSLTGKRPSLLTQCRLSAVSHPHVTPMSPPCEHLPRRPSYCVGQLFLQICSFVRPPNSSCTLDIQAVEMVECDTESEGRR